MRLEAMNETHLNTVVQIEASVFANPWRQRDFEFSLGRDGSHCLVAWIGDRLIGYTVGFFISYEYHLADFAIHPDFQEQGLGRQLLDLLLAGLDIEKTHMISLEVRVSNQQAIALYKKRDFQTLAIRKGYYSRPKEDALVMVKPLKGSLSDWVEQALNLPSENR
ncbi:MAG: ribosomal protein S18-alanine N-acetyltransferase [bacterium]|nr:ribosomal protein S18-alanine N-acetyltransferase [bacterium]